MSLIIDESYEYCHKKFDQTKRKRLESMTSSNDDYECIQVEIERLEERPPSQQTSECSSASGSTYTEQYTTTSDTTPSPYKRLRTTAFSDCGLTSSAYSTTSSSTATPYRRKTATPLAATATILPKISNETLHEICKYHGNMVRQFPKKQRTAKDQERRDKNTIACRMSRRVKKLEHVAIEEQYKEFSQQTFAIIEQAMRSTAYLHELMKMTKDTGASEERQLKMEVLEEQNPSITGHERKPFTIAYLMGNRD